MAWDRLKTSIAAVVKANSNHEITGENLQSVLRAVVDNIGANATFAGIATPDISPIVSDGPIFYLAGPGVYANFGGIQVDLGKIAAFLWDGSNWHRSEITVGNGSTSDSTFYRLELSRLVVKADADGKTTNAQSVIARVKKTTQGITSYVTNEDFTIEISYGGSSSLIITGYHVQINPSLTTYMSTSSSGGSSAGNYGTSSNAARYIFANSDSFTITLKRGDSILDTQSVSLVKDGASGEEVSSDIYNFSLDKDTQNVKITGIDDLTTVTPNTLTFAVNMSISGIQQTASVVSEHIEIAADSAVNCSARKSNNTIILENLGSSDKKIGGYVVINCYTDAEKTHLWGKLTAKYSVQITDFMLTIVDGQLESLADENTIGSLGYKIAQANTKITQNANAIEANAEKTDNNERAISNLRLTANGISSSVSTQAYNSNLFGFSNGLSFSGNCVPFIGVYGVEFVASVSGSGTIGGFGASVKGVTITFMARVATGTAESVYFRINNNNSIDFDLYVDGEKSQNNVASITTTWKEIRIHAQSVTTFTSFTVEYSANVGTLVAKNIKVETGGVATAFCISDEDGASLQNTNLFTTTDIYDSNPQSNFSGDNERLDISNADGHGTVMQFYRSNNSEQPWLFYAWTNPLKAFTSGKVYTLSFWAKTGTLPSEVSFVRLQFGLWNPNIGTGTWRAYNPNGTYINLNEGVSNIGQFPCEITPTWKRYYVRFYINTSTTAAFVARINEEQVPFGSNSDVYVYVADVRFEEGYIASDDDVFSITGAQTRSEAKFNMTANNIELKLNNTGIDIEHGTITLDAAKTNVRGELLANKVRTNDKGSGYIDMTNGLMNVFNSNGINQLRFGVDESGNIVLRYYDATTGNILWDLGPSGLEKSVAQNQNVVAYTWCLMKEWNGSSWVEGPDTLDEPSGIDILESFYSKRQNGSSESYLAYLVKNLRQGIENYPSVGNGTVWQYEAFINAGQYIGGSGTNGDKAISAEAARKYDKVFLKKVPTSLSPLTLSGSGGTTGDTTSEWYADFIRIKKIEVWRTYDNNIALIEDGEKRWAIPDNYAEGLNGYDVDWEVDTAYQTYNDPPVCFYCQHYEYGVLKEDMPFWINSSQIEGL